MSKKKTAVVTGAAGFIGSNLAIALLDRGWQVYAVDNLSTGRDDLFQEVQDRGGHALKACYGSDAVKTLMATQKPDTVFHLAAIPRVVYSVEHPLETNDNNVQKTLQLLEACKGNTKRFVFSSSSSVIGDTDVFPTPTDLPRRPISPYALQKSVMEDYCRLWSELYGLDTVSLRYFNVFGPRQWGDSPYSTVISAWCNNYVDGKALRLDGTGDQSRDFCYVDNVIDANILAATRLKPFKGDVFNIGGGQVLSVNDVLTRFRDRISVDLEIEHAPPRPGDVWKTEADMSRSQTELDYIPTVDFDEGMRRTFEWWNL